MQLKGFFLVLSSLVFSPFQSRKNSCISRAINPDVVSQCSKCISMLIGHTSWGLWIWLVELCVVHMQSSSKREPFLPRVHRDRTHTYLSTPKKDLIPGLMNWIKNERRLFSYSVQWTLNVWTLSSFERWTLNVKIRKIKSVQFNTTKGAKKLSAQIFWGGFELIHKFLYLIKRGNYAFLSFLRSFYFWTELTLFWTFERCWIVNAERWPLFKNFERWTFERYFFLNGNKPAGWYLPVIEKYISE